MRVSLKCWKFMCEDKSASFAEQTWNNTKCPTVSQGAWFAERKRSQTCHTLGMTICSRALDNDSRRRGVPSEERRVDVSRPFSWPVTRRQPIIPAGRVGSEVM
ncbi:hypothetical protein MRX96_019606 [Rhipicephalus microplus]